MSSTIVVLFNDPNALEAKLRTLNFPQGTHLSLLYTAPHRPARMKRWVSRSGWERLTAERARKMTAEAENLLHAKGATVEVHAVVGDSVWEAEDRAERAGAKLVDARAARYELPSFHEAAQAADAAMQATAQTAAQWSHALVAPVVQPQPVTAGGPKIVYKSTLRKRAQGDRE